MLSLEEKAHIEEEIKKLPFRKAAAIDALLIVQKHRGYISDDTLSEIAFFLDMPKAELDSIATFYNGIYRKKVGKNVIKICDSVSCYILKYKTILEEIKSYLNIDLGETSKDDKFTLLATQCLGCCDKAPALMINDKLYTDLNREKIKNILNGFGGENEYKKSSN